MSPPPKELNETLRLRLARAPVWPWRPSGDSPQQLALARIYEATERRGLPLPAGFLLDPEAIALRIGNPVRCFEWQMPLALHPRFGLILGNADGYGLMHPLRHTLHAHGDQAPAAESSFVVSRSYPELLDALYLLEDALSRRFACFVRLGTRREDPLADAWHALAPAADSQLRDRCAELVAELGVERGSLPFFEHFAAADTSVTVLGADALVASDTSHAISSALRLAHRLGCPAQPYAWGGERHEYPCPAVDAARVVYAFGGTACAPAVSVVATEVDDGQLWHDVRAGQVVARKYVPAGRVPVGDPPRLLDASPRLLRYLGRHGAQCVRALRSVSTIEHWIASDPDAAGWSVLADVEQQVGGLVLSANWGIERPRRFGPQLLRLDRDSVEPTIDTDVSDDGEPCLLADSWPFFRWGELSLCAIGADFERVPSTYFCDREGRAYYYDPELSELSLRATSVVQLFEKLALSVEQYAYGTGVAMHPALCAAAALADAAARELGLQPVEEASDAVSAHYASEEAWLVVQPGQPHAETKTRLYTRDPALCVRVARALRAQHPSAELFGITANDDFAQRRRTALDRADIANLRYRTHM